MSNSMQIRRLAAGLACAASIGGAAAAYAPGSAAAQTATSCGARSVAVRQGGKPLTVPVSRISVEGGATCAEALKVIRGVVLHHPPKGWDVAAGSFKVPAGLTAHVAVNGHKKVKFALPGV